MLQEIHSAYGVSQVSQDQKLLDVKKHSPPTPAPKPHINRKRLKSSLSTLHRQRNAHHPLLHPNLMSSRNCKRLKSSQSILYWRRNPHLPPPAPKPQDHQKLQASNSVDAVQIPRRKTKDKGRLGQRGDRDSFVPSLLQKTSVTVTLAVKRLAVQKVSSTSQICICNSMVCCGIWD